MGIFSFGFALIAMLLTLIAFLPLLGWLNWLFIPFSVLALIGNIVVFYLPLGGRKFAQAGVVISALCLLLGILRLHMFGGFF